MIVAPERGLKPADFGREIRPALQRNCPLCAGNERHTAHEILALRDHGTPVDGPGWRVRVVPNKFPVLRVEGSLERWGRGLYDQESGIGAHEVIIETPHHDRTLADLRVEEIRDVLWVFRARLQDLQRDLRFRYHMLFKNHGVEAGAQLDHPHSQIIAVPEIPPQIATELASARDYFRRKERCLLCDIVRQELEDRERVVLDAARFVAFTPFASALPFEIAIYPRFHSHDHTSLSDEDLLHLASAIKDVLSRLRATLDAPPYNLVLHGAPPAHPRPGRPGIWDSLRFDWHWHIEIVPRITRMAGFELGSGFHINPVVPEEAAKFLREAALSSPAG